MALSPEDQAYLRRWNQMHPTEDQYNTATGKKIPGSAKTEAEVDMQVAGSRDYHQTPAATVTGGTSSSASKPPSQASGGGTASKSAAKSTKASTSSRATVSSKAAPAAVAAPKIDNEELAQQYGLTSSLINAYPELKDLFAQAVKETWTPDKFQAKFRNSNFYKSMSDTQRKALVMSYTDPATYGQLWHTTQEHIRSLMGDLGADTNNWDQINAAAGKVIMEGWNDDMARDYLGQFIVFGSGGLAGGKAGAAQSELNAYAYSMGIQNSDAWIQDAVRNIVRGKGNMQQYKNDVMNQAVASFPGYERQLRAGSTMSDIASPYMQSMSQILEIPVGSINLFDNTVRNALSWKDPAGAAGAKPLWQFQNDLRQDERWKKTQNAQDAAMGTAHKVLQDFGMAY